MPSQRVRRRLDKVPAITRLAFAVSEVVGEALSLTLEASPLDLEPAEFEGLGTMFQEHCQAIGLGIEYRGRKLLEADQELDEARARRRQAIGHRQELVGELYDRVVDVRRRVEGDMGRRHGRFYLRRVGETSRDPEMLRRQARFLAGLFRVPRRQPRPRLSCVRHDWPALAEDLESLSDRLQAAISGASLAARQVQLALRDQRRAFEIFDHIYLRGARYLEQVLLLVGLPTLAAMVRPGVKRRGRPRKVAEEDLHPELVARVLRSLEPVDEVPAAVAESSAPSEESAAAQAETPASSAVCGGFPEDLSSAPEGLPGGPGSEKKIAQGLHELNLGEKKIAQGLHELNLGEKKIAQGLHELTLEDEKSGQGLHELRSFDASAGKAALGENPPIRRRKRVLGLGNLGGGRRAAPRPRAVPALTPVPEASPPGVLRPLRRLRGRASAWWGRLRPAA